MLPLNQYPLSAYEDVTPLCDKGHIVLVKNKENDLLYVKKYLRCYNPEVYYQLQKHPVKNTPMIWDIYEDTSPDLTPEEGGKRLIIIEDYLPGSTLTELFGEGLQLKEKEVLDISIQLCRILMELHSRQPAIIHRDIKPSNIMLSQDGTVILLDFNAAKMDLTSGSQDTVLLGTEGFAAPEQYGFSSSSPRTDIYGVGVLLNLLLTRSLPAKKLADGRCRNIIRRCLEINPKDRYQNVRELYLALKRVRDMRIPWLFPGFRSLKIYKMIPASLMYLFILILTVFARYSDFETKLEMFLFRFSILEISLMTIFFYGNYLNIRRFFPFMKSRNRFLRLLGMILAPLLIFWGMIIFVCIIEWILLSS